jgi:hypothetical protein
MLRFRDDFDDPAKRAEIRVFGLQRPFCILGRF